MKNIYYIFRFLLGCTLALGIVSCSNDQEYPEIPEVSHTGISVALSLQQTADAPTGLTYNLYIFSRNNNTLSGNYTLENILSPLTPATRLKFSNPDLSEKTYRFLFTASPADNTGISVVDTSRSALQTGISWEDIRIISQSEKLSIDNYYQVTDLGGNDILALDTIHGNLHRIVGQMIFRFFKIGTSINDPIDINQTLATSVFDRIRQIQVVYDNYTTVLAFDASGILKATVPTGEKPSSLTQNIAVTLDNFKVSLPQTDLQILANGPLGGGQIQGFYFLPNQTRMHTTLTFRYYDTTPICNNPTHIHDESCFEERTLLLSIPRTGSTGLSIQEDTYTVNKAGIRCNRVIDIGTNSNVEIQTDWNIN